MGALQMALMAAQIFSTVEPILEPFALAGGKAAFAGIEALIAGLQAKKAAGVKMTRRQIDAYASSEHGVDMGRVYRTAAMLAVASAFGVFSAVKSARR